MSAANPKDWTDDRCVELDALFTLLREVSSINHGSGCLERIANCIELAESLRKTDYRTCRMSFYSWLVGLAINDRFGPDKEGEQ